MYSNSQSSMFDIVFDTYNDSLNIKVAIEPLLVTI